MERFIVRGLSIVALSLLFSLVDHLVFPYNVILAFLFYQCFFLTPMVGE